MAYNMFMRSLSSTVVNRINYALRSSCHGTSHRPLVFDSRAQCSFRATIEYPAQSGTGQQPMSQLHDLQHPSSPIFTDTHIVFHRTCNASDTRLEKHDKRGLSYTHFFTSTWFLYSFIVPRKRATFWSPTTHSSSHTLVTKCWSCETITTPPLKSRRASISASIVSMSK